MADETKPIQPSAPPTGANPAATPQHVPVPGGDAPATAAAAAATGAAPAPNAPKPPRRAPGSAAAPGSSGTDDERRVAWRRGRTNGHRRLRPQRRRHARPTIRRRSSRAARGWGSPGAPSPRLRQQRSRRQAVSCSPTCSTSRRSSSRPACRASTAWASTSGGKRNSGYGSSASPTRTSSRTETVSTRSSPSARISGCTPNYLSAENKFKCPCHGSGYRLTGINFEGPAPRPLERARIVLADDGQILVDKSRHFQYELGQWTDPEAFLKA